MPKYFPAPLASICFFVAIQFSAGQTARDYPFLEKEIDSIVQEGLDSNAYPGAQVLVTLNGETILHKTYGHHTYDRLRPTQKNDLYDLASISKVTTGLPVLMKLYGEGKFDLDAPLGQYFPKFKHSNKADLAIREILSHQARLKPYIVYWQKTLKKNGKFKARTFKPKASAKYPVKVTDHLYLHKNYRKKMFRAIKRSPLEAREGYKYSGLFFQLLPEIINAITGQGFEEYLYQNIYRPIGANNLTYNPLSKFPKTQIIPTENDTFFRKQQIHGTVHDEAAAMLGGVSCNAGLFGTAGDLAKLFQLYLDGGQFEGETVIPQNGVAEFTKCQFCEQDNRRGLGFDKPPIEHEAGQSYVAKDASPASFGHSGFTGTFVWADPENGLLLIFLSNRVFPTRENRKLYSMDIRPRIHQAAYDFLIRE